ncbi:MAG: copper homeostasis protein CutC [Lachnospiraceae bacterium]|nr:copper homeostasis protein CutC [Lachnospiraceae bacterium]
MKGFVLEVCADSVESALAAEKGGATRIELCQNLIIGGTTPSPCMFRELRRHSNIPVHVLIRPRFGDFCYSEYEFSEMLEEIRMFRDLGAEGVVIGVLLPDGSLDVERIRLLKDAAGDMSVTLHRAFDVCADPFEAMEQAVQLGIHTILTSGQKDRCTEGADLLAELQERSRGRICILAGSGIDARAVQTLYPRTGIMAYHMSGKVTRNSPMVYRKAEVHMGLPSFSEYELFGTEESLVREVRDLLEGYAAASLTERG